MRYGSVCSGIEAATVAWAPLGWKPVFYSEIDKFPRAILKHQHPTVPLYEDFTEMEGDQYRGAIDVSIAGPPCQSFSQAGGRSGLVDPRGNLSLEYIQFAAALDSRWIVFENVTGLLSINEGRDFGAILGALATRGYGFAYRVLDSQYFAVPQHRERVYIVGFFGDWRPAAAVLFDAESLSRPFAKDRKSRKFKECAGTLVNRASSGSWPELERHDSGHLIPRLSNTISSELKKGGLNTSSLLSEEMGTLIPKLSNTISAEMGKGTVNTLILKSKSMAALIPKLANTLTRHRTDRNSMLLKNRHHANLIPGDEECTSVRKFTPVECERLQGFPDNYTRIPWRNKPADKCPDYLRYHVIGNSMTVPVIRWIGDRIERVQRVVDNAD